MKKIKRILSMVLVCVMVLALVPVTTLTASAAATGTTALFNGNATYLLQERFATLASLDGDGTRVFSGWDVDYRGGDITYDGGAMITDSNAFEKVTMSHQLMKHTGALTFESVFTFKTPVDEGFYYEVSGGDNVALRVETVRQTAGGANCLFAVNGTNTSIVPEVNTEYHLKAEFTDLTVTVWINGEKVANNVAYLASTSYIDNVELGTSETGIGKIQIKNVYAYVNYTVNENFLGKNLTGWNTANGEVVTVPGAPYSADTYGYALNPMEAVEPSYKADAPRVLVQAKTAKDYTWTGGGSKVTVTDGAEIGGRKNVVAAAGVGNANDQTIGVVIDGSNFAFAEDDLITYSYDIYLASATYARTWIRDQQGDLNPWVRVESGDHYVNAGKWTTIKRTLTYSELCSTVANDRESSGSDGWTTPGKFVVCIRPGVAQTVYLDNFVVTVTKADDNYISNVATGARVQWTKPLNSWDNNVMYSTNVSGMEYIADPAGVKSSNVLKAVVGTAGIDGVIAIKATDDFGAPIADTKVGDIIDVSFDLRSSVAQNSTATNGVALRIGGSNFANGSAGPTGAAYDMGNVNVAANTWTTIKHSYTVTSDKVLEPSSTQNLYILIRVPTAGTIYIDNLKFVIRNPEDAVLAPTWEINTASDVTWKNGGTATDANGIGGRNNVVMLSNLGNSNTNTAGVLLGTSFAFKEGDVLRYSFDAYSTAAIEPDLWVRNHGTSTNPYKQIDIASIPANTWTTRTGEVDYATLIAAGAFNTPDKFALYFRPNTSGTIYIDNFKAEVFNTNQHVLSMVDGTKIKVGGVIDEAADLTENAATLTAGQSIGGKSNVVKVVSAGGNAGRFGLKVADNYTIKQGDVLEYSVTIYPTAETTLKSGYNAGLNYILFRNSSTTPYRNVAPDVTLEANKWQTITNSIAFDDLSANLMDGTTWDVEGDYNLYFRCAGTYYISDFTAKIVRPEYAFGELPSNASLEKKFSALSGSQTLEFDVLVPTGGANGFSAKLGGATFKINGGKFYLNGTELYTPTNNVWYNIKVVTDGSTAGAYVNGALKASGVAVAGAMTSVGFENTTGKQILIDNVQVAPTFDYSDYADYPTLNDSDIANAQTSRGNLDLGMVSYPMWREGNHYGWDLITPYEDERRPYLGYYSGGSPEVADWNIKWWAEHGFDHVIYPFVRPNINEAGGQPSYSVRGEELHDGYMNAKYNDKVDFAIMLTNPLSGQFTTGQEWIDNVLPYLTETYFKKDNYKIVNNHLVVYNYDLQGFANCLTVTDEDGNVTQNGTTELIKILKALNTKAVDLGYTGLMLVIDTTANKTDEIEALTTAINNNSAVATLYKWKYSWGTDVGANVTAGIQNEYSRSNDRVASIPMGFNATPWQSSKIGFMDVSEIEEICNTVKTYRTANDPSIVLFTCWDEWGEGHFFSPASIHGFDYLNAARRILTDKAANITSSTPTEDAKKRMGVLYPEGRQMLKVREDQKEALDASIFTNALGTVTPSRDTFEEMGGCSHNSYFSRDYKTFKITDEQQSAVWYKVPSGVDFSKVTAIKVRGYAETAAALVAKYGTDDANNPFSDSVEPVSYANRYRFACANIPGSTVQDFILVPDYPGKIADAANENIKYIRINPQTNTAKNTKFYIESITFYSDELPGFDLTVDDEKKTVVSTGSDYGLSDTMIPAYKLLLDIGAKATWDKETQTLTAVKNGVTATYKNGVDGAVYSKGNIFVSYDKLLAPFGYTVKYDSASGNISYYSTEYSKTYDTKDYRWDFNKDGDREGWSLVDVDKTRYFTDGGYAATVKDGVMHLRAAGTDMNLWLSDANITRSEANYFSIKVDTDATQMYLRLYDNGTYSSGAGWTHIINVPAVDGPQDIIIDLSTATDRNGNAFSTMGDTIVSVRLDPIYGKTGSNYVDYIQFTENHPNAYDLKAYSFGDNIFTDYTAAYWQSSGTVNGNGWNTIQLTDEGDVKIQPAEGQNNGITGITWIKSGTGNDLASFVQGKIVRVSFDYKGVGDITRFRFENRDTAGSPGRDGEEFTVDVTSDWQHFDGFINVDEVTDNRRWFGIRAMRSDSTGDDYLVVRDWQIRVLDESTEVTMFTDSGVAIKAINNVDDIVGDKVHVGAFDTVNKVLTGFTSGDEPNGITVNTNDSTKTETSPYYYMAPIDVTTEIRAFWWKDLEPVTDPLILPRAN